MRALLNTSVLSFCLAYSLPQAGQAETVEQLLANASEHHGELFRVNYLEGQYLFVVGLNEVWRLTDDGVLEARATALMDEDVLHLTWDDGLGQSVEFGHDLPVTFTGVFFAPAQHVQTITTGQLDKAIGDLAKGFRFDVQGIVYSAASTVFGDWSLQGETIVITPLEGEAFTISSAELAAAITPESSDHE